MGLDGIGNDSHLLTWDVGVALLDLLGKVSPVMGLGQGSGSSPTGYYGHTIEKVWAGPGQGIDQGPQVQDVLEMVYLPK